MMYRQRAAHVVMARHAQLAALGIKPDMMTAEAAEGGDEELAAAKERLKKRTGRTTFGLQEVWEEAHADRRR